jgi:hypothetical protein
MFQSFTSLRFVKGFSLQSLTQVYFMFEIFISNLLQARVRDANVNPFACLLQKIVVAARRRPFLCAGTAYSQRNI